MLQHTVVHFTFWFLQEALSEFEVVNIEGKTPDALTVCTTLVVTQSMMNNFPAVTETYFVVIVLKNILFWLTINLPYLEYQYSWCWLP